MTDDALIQWLADGAPVALSAEERAARRHSDFARRFVEALSPSADLGPTEEAHELAVALNVHEIHRELCELGEEDYSATWQMLSAPMRAALKKYIVLANKDTR